jgi:hypothetical protein
MTDLSTELPETPRQAPSHACTTAKRVALARALTSCPGVTVASSIAVLGDRAPAYQLALVAHGFTRVTAAAPNCEAWLRERYGCLCVMDHGADDQFEAAALAALRRRLAPAGTLVLDVSFGLDRTALAERLRAAHFWMLQYRVFGMRQADGARHRAVFMIARAPRSPLRAVPAGAELAELGLAAVPRQAA